jgi:hypothetical protein
MLSRSPVPGYPIDRPLDLSSSNERARLSPSAIRGFVEIVKKWDLSEAQARGLLGGVSSSIFHAWKKHPDGESLEQDTLVRVSLVIGIYTALNICFSLEQQLADRWITRQNDGLMFSGRTPIEHMLREGLPGMFDVRGMLDAECAGQ